MDQASSINLHRYDILSKPSSVVIAKPSWVCCCFGVFVFSQVKLVYEKCALISDSDTYCESLHFRAHICFKHFAWCIVEVETNGFFPHYGAANFGSHHTLVEVLKCVGISDVVVGVFAVSVRANVEAGFGSGINLEMLV